MMMYGSAARRNPRSDDVSIAMNSPDHLNLALSSIKMTPDIGHFIGRRSRRSANRPRTSSVFASAGCRRAWRRSPRSACDCTPAAPDGAVARRRSDQRAISSWSARLRSPLTGTRTSSAFASACCRSAWRRVSSGGRARGRVVVPAIAPATTGSLGGCAPVFSAEERQRRISRGCLQNGHVDLL